MYHSDDRIKYKQCTNCLKVKTIDSFYSNGNGKIYPSCKSCDKEYQRNRYLSSKLRISIKKRNRIYYSKNKIKICNRQRDYRKKCKDIIKTKSHKYYELNKKK